MANHKSSIKRIRQEEKRRLHNRYYAKTMRNAVKKLPTFATAKGENAPKLTSATSEEQAWPVRLSVRTQDFHS